MVCVALGSLYQISRQVFASPDPSSSPYKTCQEGLSALHASLSDGREVAIQHAHKTSQEASFHFGNFGSKWIKAGVTVRPCRPRAATTQNQ